VDFYLFLCCSRSVRIPIFISLEQVTNGGGVDDLTKVIIGVLKKHDGLCDVDVVVKLISFGVH